MRRKDLSIGYEIWARPNLGVQESKLKVYEEFKWPADFVQYYHQFWKPIEEFTLLGDQKAYVIYQHARAALNLDGDLAEFGCFKGGLSYMLGFMVRNAETNKRILMFDNFDAGLPKPDAEFDQAYQERTMAFPVKRIYEQLSKFGLKSQCIVYPGLFSDTLKNIPSDQRFSLVHIDCDLYAGAKECLQFVYDRLAPGAPVIIDDYYDESHGVMIALNEFAQANEIVVHLSTQGQAYWIKNERPEDTDARLIDIEDHRIWLSTDGVRNAPGFLDWMQALVADRQERTQRLENFVKFCTDW